jgi:hypothetical protein
MSTKSQQRRLRKKYPPKPRIVPALLDLERAIYDSYAPISAVTVELVDEDDPDGAVVFRDADGRPTMWMPHDVYEHFKLRPAP